MKYSFTLYFTHQLLIYPEAVKLHAYMISHYEMPHLCVVAMDIVLWIAMVAVLLLLAMLMKRAFGRRSRSFIGS